jgi:hypothetical protein
MSPHLPLAERVRRGIVQRLGGPGGGGGVRPAALRAAPVADPAARQHNFQRPVVAMRREYARGFEELDQNGFPLVMPPAVPLLRV